MSIMIACGGQDHGSSNAVSSRGGRAASVTATGGATASGGSTSANVTAIGGATNAGGAATDGGGTGVETGGGDGNAGGTASTTTLGATGGRTCPTYAAGQPRSAPPVIEFVIDNTSSMLDTTAPSTAGLSKWAVLKDAFASAIEMLSTAHPEYAIGLTYFHTQGYGPAGSPCTDALQAVEIQPISRNATALVNNLRAEGTMLYGPTQDIWHFAADHALAWGTAEASYASSNRYVVLVTDGAPNVAAGCAAAAGCVTAGGANVSVDQFQTFIDLVGQYKTDHELTTFVIVLLDGSALSAAACTTGGPLYAHTEKLGAVATAGGTNLLDLTRVTNLSTALTSAIAESIAGAVATADSCTYAVPDPPVDPVTGAAQFIDPTTISVSHYLNGGASCSNSSECAGGHCSYGGANMGKCFSRVPRSIGCTEPNGWDYADANNRIVGLCSGACSTVRADTVAKIELVLGCPWVSAG